MIHNAAIVENIKYLITNTILNFSPKDESPKPICEEESNHVQTPMESGEALSRFFMWIPFNCLLTCGFMMVGYGIIRFFDGQFMDMLLRGKIFSHCP